MKSRFYDLPRQFCPQQVTKNKKTHEYIYKSGRSQHGLHVLYRSLQRTYLSVCVAPSTLAASARKPTPLSAMFFSMSLLRPSRMVLTYCDNINSIVSLKTFLKHSWTRRITAAHLVWGTVVQHSCNGGKSSIKKKLHVLYSCGGGKSSIKKLHYSYFSGDDINEEASTTTCRERRRAQETTQMS